MAYGFVGKLQNSVLTSSETVNLKLTSRHRSRKSWCKLIFWDFTLKVKWLVENYRILWLRLNLAGLYGFWKTSLLKLINCQLAEKKPKSRESIRRRRWRHHYSDRRSKQRQIESQLAKCVCCCPKDDPDDWLSGVRGGLRGYLGRISGYL